MSGVQPKSNGCPSGIPTKFILQTFGAYKTEIIADDAKTQLLKSKDFQGIKFGNVEDPTYRNTTYTKASYSGRPLRDTDGNLVFTASEEKVSLFLDEDQVPGFTS